MKRGILTSIYSTIASFLVLSTFVAEAYYPVGCYYVKESQFTPVVGVQAGRPLIQTSAGIKKVDSDEISFQRLELYGDGFIEILDVSAHAAEAMHRDLMTYSAGSVVLDKAYIDLELLPDRNIKDCYALVVSGSELGMEAKDLDEVYVSFFELGDLTKGVVFEKRLQAFVKNAEGREFDARYCLIFYENGMPIASNLDALSVRHFRARVAQEHALYLEQYLKNNSGRDQKHTAFQTFVPYLPKQLYEKLGGVDAKVVFTVLADGHVQVEKISGVKDAQALAFLEERIEEWLFFPKLEDGLPVPVRTATMIQY